MYQHFTFQIQTISLNFFRFRFLLNLHQHTTCASPCFYLFVSFTFCQFESALPDFSYTWCSHVPLPFSGSHAFSCTVYAPVLLCVSHFLSHFTLCTILCLKAHLYLVCILSVLGLPAAEYSTCMYLYFCQQDKRCKTISSTRMSCSCKADITWLCLALLCGIWLSLLSTWAFWFCKAAAKNLNPRQGLSKALTRSIAISQQFPLRKHTN